MTITLRKVTYEQKSVLRNLLELYKYDFSEYDPMDINVHGLYEYKYLDHYWTEDGRHPFFIEVDEKLAGFALVCKLGVNDSELEIYSMAEFFVMKKYRRMGVGSTVAKNLFSLFPGVWKVSQIEENTPSLLFWRRLIGEYTNHNYEEGRREDLKGPLQTFVSEKLAKKEF
jgi:predicted acetyltransferase